MGARGDREVWRSPYLKDVDVAFGEPADPMDSRCAAVADYRSVLRCEQAGPQPLFPTRWHVGQHQRVRTDGPQGTSVDIASHGAPRDTIGTQLATVQDTRLPAPDFDQLRNVHQDPRSREG